MPLPIDERQHVEAIRERERAAQRKEEQLREVREAEIRLLRGQARKVVETCPELMEHIRNRAAGHGPAGATASERSVWRCGILDALHWIEAWAKVEEPTNG